MNDAIKQLDMYGNTQGREGQELMAGEMQQDQEVPEGCTLYHDPRNAPLYGSEKGHETPQRSRQTKHNYFVNRTNKGDK